MLLEQMFFTRNEKSYIQTLRYGDPSLQDKLHHFPRAVHEGRHDEATSLPDKSLGFVVLGVLNPNALEYNF